MRKLLVLGAGTAGTMVANKLRQRLDRARLERSPSSTATTSTTTSPATCSSRSAATPASRSCRSRHAFLADGVDLVARRDRPGRARPDTSCSSSDGRTLPYDYLVIATGTTPRPDQTPGMLGPEWRRSIFDFYTLEGAEALADALERLRPRPAGRAHHRDADQVPGRAAGVHLPRRGVAARARPPRPGRAGLRDAADGAFTKPVASAHLGADARRAQDRTSRPTSWSSGSTPSSKMLVSYDEREVPFDLLVTVPLNMGADFVARSGLGDELNYVPVDKHTLLSTQYDNIFALGDASDIPASKAGSVAHFAVEIFVDNFLAARRRARPMTGSFDGHANCFVESGDEQGAADRLQLRHRAAAGQVPAPRRRTAEPAQGDPRQPPREARLPLDLLERPASRTPDPAAGPHVDGRQARPRTKRGGLTPCPPPRSTATRSTSTTRAS